MDGGLVTVLLAHDPLSSLAYPMITHASLVASNLPIKTLVAMAKANNYYYDCACVCVHVCI